MNPTIVYCDGAFLTPNGKTAHGLVRFTERYTVGTIIDARHAGGDAGDLLDDKPNGIPVVKDFAAALEAVPEATYFVVGLATDGGALPPEAREVVAEALGKGLNVDSGLHDFLSDDPRLVELAGQSGAQIRDVRKPPARKDLHFFSGEIKKVQSTIVAVLGTDSAVGKRTTAWMLVHALRERGLKAELIGTGQTAWMQGAKYSFVLDSLIADFLPGEIEHAVLRAWDDEKPDVIVLEGQGSLLHPAFPGGFELLAAGRPHGILLQHSPTRAFYDGTEDEPLHPLPHQMEALRVVSGKPILALTLNHEGLDKAEVPALCAHFEAALGLPTLDPLLMGAGRLADIVQDLHTARTA